MNIQLPILALLWIVFAGAIYLQGYPENTEEPMVRSKILVPRIETASDTNKDGQSDIENIIDWARKEATNKTVYRSTYFQWGYPPEGEWVCTDVIWRAFKNAGIDFKSLIDSDIKTHAVNYIWNIKKADPNIDFRRVPNIDIFLKRHANILTKEIIPGNVENLKEWQAGDVVVFSKPNQHIAIVSDRRDENGVPYLLHSYGDFAKEDIWVLYADRKILPIVGHYRWKYAN